jgi:hypothetical protein
MTGGMLDIRLVAGRDELLEFIQLPRILYAGAAGFVPPLDIERLEFLDPARAAFFAQGRAAYWIARRNGRAVGRISAQIDELAIKTWGARIGTFGALDAVDDRATVAALLDVAARWLAEAGMVRIRGPLTLSMSGEVGAQLDGQEHGPLVLMPWHPAYLAAHIEVAGLAKAKDVHSYTLTMDKAFGRRFAVDIAAEPPPRPGFTFRHLDMKNLARDTEIIRNVYNDAWHDNWGHVPLSQTETAELAKALRFLIKADYGVIVEFNGEPVGVGLLMPNVFELLTGLDGRLLPFNWLRVAWRFLRHRCVHGRVAIFGVKRAIRDGRYGAGHSVVAMRLIMRSLLQGAWQNGFRLIDMGWILEDNRVRKIPEQYGAVLTKRYRIFERDCATR